MKPRALIIAVFLIIAVMGTHTAAAPWNYTKVMPQSLNYPLILPAPYPTPRGDPYQASFGVRRMLTAPQPDDYVDTLIESLNFFRSYGCYGVLGRGEDVFTAKAAQYRRHYQGR
ncbi:MAG: hypothetical protein LDL33_13475 [Desulfomonile sp.]|nr:hypothetical protein [Desulfomonile sp.]